MKYEWLLFDADNTLWDFSAAEASALERTLVKRDIAWSEEVLGDYRLINHRVWSDYEAGNLPKTQLRTIRFSRLLEQYRLDHPAEELSIDYRTYLAESTHMLAGAVELLESVRDRYKLAMITNGLKEVQRPRLRSTQLEKYFEFIVISDEIGAAKPNAVFFDHAYRQMAGVDKSKVLVIGDNPNADVRGALDYGFDACWLRHPGTPDHPKLGATHKIRDIRELAQHV
ncbi:YjjG family noncanonical pyrimidine nucleotidase [Neolewinella antarctica]|uniref:YjjG family noncanonical pyrimidine nucleotidase n=1 Tax=Neolewinella antarctica TaxID=442734 RepID=A0ABX0X7D9_9BACT|nr:YjjG family noncanonical pyrimidine nucleotidase [Neolewinella antarctica]NJC25164.1 YjjG family noncanonical pyrimidine nucleotidase [Neolewinella antarctica]